MDIFTEIESIISDLKKFLMKVDAKSTVQVKIYVENRINEIGEKVNSLFYGDHPGLDFNYTDALFRIIHLYKPILNFIPVDQEFIKIRILGESLLFFLLTNYIYLGREEVHRLTSFAMTLSNLLTGLPDPRAYFPKSELKNVPKNMFFSALKAFDAICSVYYNAVSGALSMDEETHLLWIDKYFEYFIDLRQILSGMKTFIAEDTDIQKAYSFFDMAVTPAIYYSTFIHVILATYPQLANNYPSYRTELDGLNIFLEETRQILIDKFESGQISKNDAPHKNRIYNFANIGIGYFQLKRSFLEFISAYFEGEHPSSIMDQSFSIYQRLKENLLIQGFPISKSPYTPVAHNILMTSAALLFLEPDNQEGREKLYDIIESDFQLDFRKDFFDMYYIIAVLRIIDCKEGKCSYEDIRPYLTNLRKIPQMLNSDKMAIYSLCELSALSFNFQTLDVTLHNLAEFQNTDLTDDLSAHSSFSDFIAKVKATGQGQSFSSHINPFDVFTWTNPHLEYNGAELPFPMFNSFQAKLLGKYSN